MIIFDDVTKTFPLGNIGLDHASFHIDDGEFVFLVGPSGAGKTTILKLLLREYLPTKGSITINTFQPSDAKFHDIEKLRRSIGMVYQDFKILPDRTIFDNISLALEVTGMSQKKIKDEVNESLKITNLLEKRKQYPVQLSAGELQRVAIARAIAGDRSIILADEPTGNLDPKTTWEIMRIFTHMEKKKTIIIATHNTDIVNSMQKRVILLRQGKVVKDVKKGGYEL